MQRQLFKRMGSATKFHIISNIVDSLDSHATQFCSMGRSKIILIRKSHDIRFIPYNANKVILLWKGGALKLPLITVFS